MNPCHHNGQVTKETGLEKLVNKSQGLYKVKTMKKKNNNNNNLSLISLIYNQHSLADTSVPYYY